MSRFLFYLTSLIILVPFLLGCQPEVADPIEEVVISTGQFDGESALAYVEAQLQFGPRYPGSPGHDAVRLYIIQELLDLGWRVDEQPFEYGGILNHNLIGRINVGQGAVTIIGAHYDTRRIADQSPGHEETPVMGAVDGASGVAVLLELAKQLDETKISGELWLVFFDAEDNGSGGIEGWDWIVGSTYFATHLPDDITVDQVVIVDMIGDASQQIYYEGYSDPELQSLLWEIGASLGYGAYFIPELKYTMIDDHYPFVQQGIRAVDLIDFDYPYWHTIDDTIDKVSADSLLRVGQTLQLWLEGEYVR